MGKKTTINDKGIFTEKVAGNDQLIVSLRKRDDVHVVSASGNGTIGNKPLNVFEAGTTAVTASLPLISAGNVGLRITCVNVHPDNPLVLSGATGQPVNSASLEYVVSGTSGYVRGVEVVACSSSHDGFGWYTING